MPSLTMSIPVTSSVTGCSTCTRVFISRKKYSPSWSRPSIVPGAGVVDGGCGVGGDLPDLRAQLVVHRRRRGLLDQLLVAALDRAVALAEMDHVAVLVGQDLDLDVARVGQVALEVHGRVGEELLALARGALERVLELVLGERDAEALAAAATRGLDRHRIADRVLDQPSARPRSSAPARSFRARSAPPPWPSARARGSSSPSPRSREAGGPMNVMPSLLERARRRRRSRPGSRSRGARPRRPIARSPRAASRSFR